MPYLYKKFQLTNNVNEDIETMMIIDGIPNYTYYISDEGK